MLCKQDFCLACWNLICARCMTTKLWWIKKALRFNSVLICFQCLTKLFVTKSLIKPHALFKIQEDTNQIEACLLFIHYMSVQSEMIFPKLQSSILSLTNSLLKKCVEITRNAFYTAATTRTIEKLNQKAFMIHCIS